MQQPVETPGGAMRRHAVRAPAESAEGSPVFELGGRKIAVIDGVVLDKSAGRLVYAVLRLAGFLGWGKSYHPVPWPLLTYVSGVYVLPLSRGEVLNGPRLPARELKGWSDASARAAINDYYAIYRSGAHGA